MMFGWHNKKKSQSLVTMFSFFLCVSFNLIQSAIKSSNVEAFVIPSYKRNYAVVNLYPISLSRAKYHTLLKHEVEPNNGISSVHKFNIYSTTTHTNNNDNEAFFINEDDPYELIIDSLIQKDEKEDESNVNQSSQFVDGLLISDLLMESFGAESVVTTKAFDSTHVNEEIRQEALEQQQLLQNLVKESKQTDSNQLSSTSSLSSDIFDEPDVDYSKELSENSGPVPSHSINLEDTAISNKTKKKKKKKRKVWSHSQIVARMPPISQTFMSPEIVVKCLEQNINLSSDQFLQYQTKNINVEEEEKMDWCKEVQKSWPPSLLSDDILITLPFHTNEDCINTLDYYNKNNEKSRESIDFDKIVIEGGSAFGTGDHPTSRMCSEWLLKECNFQNIQIKSDDDGIDPKLRVMDYGSGSGILSFIALLAAKRQNKLDNIRVDGVEVDPIAIESARRNTLLNEFTLIPPIDNVVQNNHWIPGVQFYGPMEGTPGSELWDEITGIASDTIDNSIATTTDSEATNLTLLPSSCIGVYDVLIANILAQPLINLMRTLAMLLKPGVGRLALSGLVLDQVDCVIQAYKPFFSDIHVVSENKGWVLLEGTRNRQPTQHPLDTYNYNEIH